MQTNMYRKKHNTQSWSSNEFEMAMDIRNIVLYKLLGIASWPVLRPVSQSR